MRERPNLVYVHRAYWLAEQGFSAECSLFAIFSLLFYVIAETLSFLILKGDKNMKKWTNVVRSIFLIVVTTISGNIAGSALLANVLYDN